VTDAMTDTQIAAWETAAKALVRGGHKKEPPLEVQRAATNWVIQQELAKFLLDAIASGEYGACLKVDKGKLLFVSDKPFKMEIELVDIKSGRAL
jgi:hypothetical protein